MPGKECYGHRPRCVLVLRTKKGLVGIKKRGTYEEIVAREPDRLVIPSDDSAVDIVCVFIHILSEDIGLKSRHFSILYSIRGSGRLEV